MINSLTSYYCYCRHREGIIHDHFSITSPFRVYNILSETCTRLKLFDPDCHATKWFGYIKPLSPVSACSLLNRLETPPSN